MPVQIPDALPATSILQEENIFVMTETRAIHQDIRPLRVLVLNLMPTKIVTETQLMRKLSNTPLQIEIELMHMASHKATNVTPEHLETFYRTFDDVKDNCYDGLIVTGAPVEKLNFDEVDYWDELCEIFEWSRTNVFSCFFICWGAQAALNYFYNIPKHDLSKKKFGIFPHRLIKSTSPLVRGFNDVSYMPHSRHTEVRYEDILANEKLEVITYDEQVGPSIVKSTNSRHFFVFGHPEYDHDTLKREYERDVAAGLPIHVPLNYFPDDDPTKEPIVKWRAEAQLLYTNWLNYYVYQSTPYNLVPPISFTSF